LSGHLGLPTLDDGRPYLHLRVAEHGKLLVLQGQLRLALAHFRWAMKAVLDAGDPEAFSRLYLELVVETLERMGALDDVLRWCDEAEAFYSQPALEGEALAMAERAHAGLKRGVTLLRRGEADRATEALSLALSHAEAAGQRHPLVERLHRWGAQGLHIDPARLEAELQQHRYYIIRADSVRPEIALALPPELLPPGSL
jgi:hypothetical protein